MNKFFFLNVKIYKIILLITIYLYFFFNSLDKIINKFYYINKKSNYKLNKFKKIKDRVLINNKKSILFSLYETANKSKEFIKRNFKGLLFKKINLNFNIIPKVSIVIPMYNCQKTIKRVIRSIQNQNMSEIEIILINDFSLDNTLNIIEQIKLVDSRIKIINNKKNMGILYSRCIGTLYSKAKYIFPLDNDDMFLTEDIINLVYKDAKLNHLDIITFKAIIAFNLNDFLNNNNLKEFRNHKHIKIFHQPELGDSSIGKYVIWGKCIKAKLYKRAIKELGKKRYYQYVTYLEDGIIRFIIEQFADSSKNILKYGILHLCRHQSVSHSMKDIKKNIFIIKYIEIAFDFSRNTKKAKEGIAIYIITFLRKKHFSIINTLKNKIIYKKFDSLFKKILNSNYISLKSKILIKKNIIKKLIYLKSLKKKYL